MYILEAFDEELYERDLKDIAYENGVREGEAAARAADVENVMRNLKFSLEEACRALGITVEEYEKARRVL